MFWQARFRYQFEPPFCTSCLELQGVLEPKHHDDDEEERLPPAKEYRGPSW